MKRENIIFPTNKVSVIADLPRPNTRASSSNSPVETETNRDDELSGEGPYDNKPNSHFNI